MDNEISEDKECAACLPMLEKKRIFYSRII